MADSIFTISDAGELSLHLHRYQDQTLYSQAQTTFNLKGWRAGGTSLMPFWLMNEMIRCGPGNPALNYFAAMPTLAAGRKALIPEIERIFCTVFKIGVRNKNENTITTTPEGERMLWGHAQRERTPIAFVYADDPTSFGSMTSIGGVADEVGQSKFKLEAWRTLQSRLLTQRGRVAPGNRHPSLQRFGFPRNMKCGRILAASTVWNLGWLQDEWNRHRRLFLEAAKEYVQELKAARTAAERQRIKNRFRAMCFLGSIIPEIHFIRYESSANPVNTAEELAKLRAMWPEWFYNMRIRAIFSKPAGVIFEDWNEQQHIYQPTENFGPDNLPAKWPRRVAIDFGKRNFWALFFAHDEERNRHFLYHAYHDSNLSNEERAAEILKIDPRVEWCVAGQVAEESDRIELLGGGLTSIAPRFKGMWNQINLIGSAVKNNRLFTFDGVSDQFKADMRSFSRPVDDAGNVDLDGDPEDHETFHTIACLRYYASWWFSSLADTLTATVHAGGEKMPVAPDASQSVAALEGNPSYIFAGRPTDSGIFRELRYGPDSGCFEPHLDINL